MDATRLVAGGLLACTLVAQAAAHVTLRYPTPTLQNDFLDNVRTQGLCGGDPTGEGAAWMMPGENASSTDVTDLTPGQPLNVSWDLHYAHQGGFRIELYDTEMALKHAWDSEEHWGCSVDSTVQEVTVTLPTEPCTNCTMRFIRQALEWGDGYLFKSCAKVNIGPAGDACQGCSGHGTCGADGACTCDSSPATGFFYGAHCEYENECATDAHCGANGKCIDVGDVSGPALQCFCEAGFFGAVETRPSGLQVRTCTRASDYAVPAGATFANFLDAYNTTLEAPGGTFKAGVAPMGPSVEIAMAAQTTSWVAIGMRASAAAGAKAPGAEGEAEPAAEGEADAAKPAGAEAAAEGAGAATAPAAESEAPSRRRRLAQAEAAPAAEGEAPAAEGEGAAAEGEGGGSVCPQQSTVFQPSVLGAGEAKNGTAAAPAAVAEGEAPAAEGEAPAEAPAEGAAAAEAPAAGRRLMRMPVVEAETVSFGRRLREDHEDGDHDHDADAEGEAEGEGAAEGEGGGKVGKPVEITTGPCAGFYATPGSAHAMVNQDVVFGAARMVDGTQYFRVVDMFTPSRAKPLPDHEFCFEGTCGTDSIEDAIGMEVAGVSYFIVKRKAVPDAGQLSDTCLTVGQNYHVIYAYGQLTANASHTPASSLEIIPDGQKSNQDFYQVDELKYHGGGIGVSFPGRGVLNPNVDILAAPTAGAVAPAGAACLPSTEADFDCMQSQLQGDVIIHYNLRADGDTEATMAIETPNPGWVAVGWPTTPGMMLGATAVIATTDAAAGDLGVFTLESKSVDGIVEMEGAVAASRRLAEAAPVTLTAASVEKTGGRTIATFTRPFDAEFTGEGEMDMICAYHDTDAAIAYHTGREGFLLSLEGAAAAPAAVATPRDVDADEPAPATDADSETDASTVDEPDASSTPVRLAAAAAATAAAVGVAIVLL
eukprot:jgi/Ulvmu1/9530/UM053_0019.1